MAFVECDNWITTELYRHLYLFQNNKIATVGLVLNAISAAPHICFVQKANGSSCTDYNIYSYY